MKNITRKDTVQSHGWNVSEVMLPCMSLNIIVMTLFFRDVIAISSFLQWSKKLSSLFQKKKKKYYPRTTKHFHISPRPHTVTLEAWNNTFITVCGSPSNPVILWIWCLTPLGEERLAKVIILSTPSPAHKKGDFREKQNVLPKFNRALLSCGVSRSSCHGSHTGISPARFLHLPALCFLPIRFHTGGWRSPNSRW